MKKHIKHFMIKISQSKYYHNLRDKIQMNRIYLVKNIQLKMNLVYSKMTKTLKVLL
jgi:hypothetical protein